MFIYFLTFIFIYLAVLGPHCSVQGLQLQHVPDQGSNLGPLHWKVQSLSHWTTREVPGTERFCYDQLLGIEKSLIFIV